MPGWRSRIRRCGDWCGTWGLACLVAGRRSDADATRLAHARAVVEVLAGPADPDDRERDAPVREAVRAGGSCAAAQRLRARAPPCRSHRLPPSATRTAAGAAALARCDRRALRRRRTGA